MKPGDLVTTTCAMNGSRYIHKGELGLVLGPARDAKGHEYGCFAVMIAGTIEDIHSSRIKVINEDR